ncbi:MAG: nucleotidyltransferase domain-containing protein [Promethearchaeota archaeon]
MVSFRQKISKNAVKDNKYLQIIIDYLDELNEKLVSNIKAILLFGSLSKGKEKPFETAESDVDLLVLSEELPPMRNRVHILRELQADPRVRSLLYTFNEIENSLTSSGIIMDALADGIILYDPEKILNKLREKFKEELSKKGIKRTPEGWFRDIKIGEIVEL